MKGMRNEAVPASKDEIASLTLKEFDRNDG